VKILREREEKVKSLEEKINYTFRSPDLLENALTHSSYANEHREEGVSSNERLEFLGDSILGLIVAEHLYRLRPDLPEGDLTRIRAALVCENSLVEVAKRLGVGNYLRLGKGEQTGGGRERPSIQADAVEAILAAVYLDGGIGQVRKIIRALILERGTEKTAATRDYKTALQEIVQRESGKTLAYRLVAESGPDHAKLFAMEVQLNGVPIGSGQGKSKKEAEQAAAKTAVKMLEDN
jgi:ribonuclease-3